MNADAVVIVNLSGRGDKDVAQAARFVFGEELKF
jgi:tryptophan synthase beta chain